MSFGLTKHPEKQPSPRSSYFQRSEKRSSTTSTNHGEKQTTDHGRPRPNGGLRCCLTPRLDQGPGRSPSHDEQRRRSSERGTERVFSPLGRQESRGRDEGNTGGPDRRLRQHHQTVRAALPLPSDEGRRRRASLTNGSPLQVLQPRHGPLRVRVGRVLPLLPVRLRGGLLPGHRPPRALLSAQHRHPEQHARARRRLRRGRPGARDGQVHGLPRHRPEHQRVPGSAGHQLRGQGASFPQAGLCAGRLYGKSTPPPPLD